MMISEVELDFIDVCFSTMMFYDDLALVDSIINESCPNTANIDLVSLKFQLIKIINTTEIILEKMNVKKTEYSAYIYSCNTILQSCNKILNKIYRKEAENAKICCE